jgi:DNA-binding transcriptional ArsR family regulator
MSATAQPPKPFRGFVSPNYTSVPDELFDEFLAVLSGAELKVLLYVVRRTFGFKKESDAISLNQLVDGITTRDGRRLDYGTGLSQSTVQVALKGLIEKNLIVATKRVSRERGNEATTYALNVLTPSAETRQTPSPEIGEGLHRKSAPQDTVTQETGLQPSKLRSANTEWGGEETGRTREAAAGNSPTGFQAVGSILDHHRRASVPEDAVQILRPYISEVAHAFGDRAPLASSTVRAVNLLRRSGVAVPVFIARLYEARSLTKDRVRVVNTTTIDRPAARSVKLQMAYFFTVLEQLLGVKERLPPKAAA